MPPEETRFSTVLDFLVWRFNGISKEQWQQRMLAGKVHWDNQQPITVDAGYAPHQRIFYYREVAEEPVIPFAEQVVYQNEHLLVACKPHFLPVTPGGPYVQECLLNRLRESTGISTLAPVHRIDRETAGLVMFSVHPETRGLYHDLFMKRNISKRYHAVAHCSGVEIRPGEERWIENRMEIAEPKFRMRIVEGESNTRSRIKCLLIDKDIGLFELKPVTGKRHQLRVHMSSLEMPLVNERYYPELQPESEDDFQAPLQLLAKSLEFTDPISGQEMHFVSERELQYHP